MSLTIANPRAAEGEGKRRATRGRRYLHRQFLWEHASLKRVRACGRNRVTVDQPVQVKVADGISHLANVQSCGSTWACPVCAPKVREGRADEWRRAKALHRAQGGGVALLTLTTRHHRGQTLAEVFDAVAQAYRRTIGNRGWVEDREAFGIIGSIRSMEVTWGAENGWHPHLHVLVLFDHEPAGWEIDQLEQSIWERWRRAIVGNGMAEPTRSAGIDLRVIDADDDRSDDYPFKWDDAAELTRADLKQAHGKGAAPWQMLAQAVDDGDAQALALWNEYEAATKGRQAVTWSKGLKKRFGVDEVTDEELADVDAGGEVVIELNELEWRNVKRTRGAIADVLDLAELGEPIVRAYLRDLAGTTEVMTT